MNSSMLKECVEIGRKLNKENYSRSLKVAGQKTPKTVALQLLSILPLQLTESP